MAEEKQEFNCSICLSDFRKPKILGCIYTFCESCLGDYISKFAENGTFKCPICRKTIQIPTGGVSRFPGNIYVTDNFQVTDESPEKTPSCDVCKKGVDSEFQCKDCDQFLCGSCKTTHDTFSVCLLHDVVHVSEKTTIEEPKERLPSICQRHERKFAVYCLTCSLVVCSKCSQKDHSCHEVRNISDIGDTVDKARRELKTILGNFSRNLPDLYQIKTAITTQIAILKTSTNEACKDVDEQVEKVCKLVTKQGEKLKGDLKYSEKEQECSLSVLHSDVKNVISELESRSKQLSEDLDKFDSVNMLTVLPELRDRLDSMTRQPFSVPLIKIPEFKISLLDRDDLFQTIELNSIPMQESIDFQFKCDYDEWSYSFKFALDGYTLYIKAQQSHWGSEIHAHVIIKSVSGGFPHSLPSVTFIKNNIQSCQKNFDKQKQVNLDVYNNEDFIDEYRNFTVRLTQR